MLIIGLTKLCLVTISNKLEIKELFYNTPLLVDLSPDIMKSLLILDGFVCIFGGIALLCL